MALSLTKIKSDVWGTSRMNVWDVTFDNSYPTGGEPLTVADLGMSTQLFAVQCYVKGNLAAYEVTYDHTNSKLKVSGVEQDADAATTEPFDEENNTADLSSLVVRVMAIGY